MLELGLIAALFFILLAVIASYLLKSALIKSGIAESNMEKTTLIAIGMPPTTSVKGNLILPGSVMPGGERLCVSGRVYIWVVRAALILAVLSLIVGAAFEWGAYA